LTFAKKNQNKAVNEPKPYPTRTCGHVWKPNFTRKYAKNAPIPTTAVANNLVINVCNPNAFGSDEKARKAYKLKKLKDVAWELGIPGSIFFAPLGLE